MSAGALVWHKACRVADVRDGEPVGVKLAGTPVGVYRVGDRCHAVHDVCTHEYALLSQGWQDGAVIECPLHQAKFDVTTGTCLAGPAHDALATFPVRLDGDDVLVGLAAKS
jgi:nitrite reductase/ring-hydroxylating ferredoxin subunit